MSAVSDSGSVFLLGSFELARFARSANFVRSIRRLWTAQSMRPGSVCRHLKIAGRVPIWRFFHVTSQQPRKVATHPFLQTERLAWVFELAFPMNSHHDFGVSHRSQCIDRKR